MIWQHFRTVLWLRWRLRVNQIKRAGTVNAIIMAIAAVAAVCFALVSFVVILLVGLLVLPKAPPPVLMYVWDGLVLAFLAFWVSGLLTDLQRSEALSLDKFLHLPVSLTGAFLVNYMSSLVSLSLILFLPAMVGLSLALVWAKGPALLLLLPLLAAYLLMVTGVTHQFQGWLASLMVNRRRRRTVVAVVTMILVFSCQLPNLLNILAPWKRQLDDEQASRRAVEQELKRLLQSQEITLQQFQERKEKLERDYRTQVDQSNRESAQEVEEWAWFANLVLPIGWLPFGAMTLAEGNVLPALLGTAGLTLIGAGSLWRSYRTTVRLYRGQFTSGKKRLVAPAAPTKDAKPSVGLLEAELPGLSGHASAIALAGFRSLTRAPEAKMVLLTPIIMVVVFGSMFLAKPINPPELVRPLLPFGAISMILLSLVHGVGNQFGYDRTGFRVYVLSAAPRREVLIGKNMAVAPLALGMCVTLTALLQVAYPMRIDHCLATLPQLISMYLVFCLVANCLSILAPMPIAAGSLRPVSPRLIPLLLQMAFTFLLPVILIPTLAPLGLELLSEALEWTEGVPIYLALALLECGAVVLVYRLVVTWQGSWLQARELRILEAVTTKAE